MPKFSSSTQLVVEIVSVKDKSGNIVEGLTAQGLHRHRKRRSADHHLLRVSEARGDGGARATPAAPPPLRRRSPKAAPVTNTQIATETPGDIKFRDRRLLAIYFDMSAMPVPDQLRALTAAQKFIKTQMTKADLLAIMKFEGGACR